MKLNHFREAYIIAAETTNNTKMYFSYDYDNNYYDWSYSVFDANLYNDLEDINTFMRVITRDHDKYSYIKKIWIEKFSAAKCEESIEVNVNT